MVCFNDLENIHGVISTELKTKAWLDISNRTSSGSLRIAVVLYIIMVRVVRVPALLRWGHSPRVRSPNLRLWESQGFATISERSR